VPHFVDEQLFQVVHSGGGHRTFIHSFNY